MCMLYGFNSNKSIDVTNSLKSFYRNSYSQPHGWGIGVIDNGLSIIKESNPAHLSRVNREVLRPGIKGSIVIGHIRYATLGEISYKNTHPFNAILGGENWMLAHNGSINSLNLMKMRTPGESDSEKILYYILGRLKRFNKMSFEIKALTIEDCIINLAKFGKLNLLITDGTHLFAHANYDNSLFIRKKEGSVEFSTTPLTSEGWKKVELNRLLIYKDGEMVYRGGKHKSQYFKVGRDLSEGICIW